MCDTAFDGMAGHNGERDDCDRINVVILHYRVDAGRRALSKLRRVAYNLAEDIELQVRLRRPDALLDSRPVTGENRTSYCCLAWAGHCNEARARKDFEGKRFSSTSPTPILK